MKSDSTFVIVFAVFFILWLLINLLPFLYYDGWYGIVCLQVNQPLSRVVTGVSTGPSDAGILLMIIVVVTNGLVYSAWITAAIDLLMKQFR